MLAAVRAVKELHPARVVVGVPVAPAETVEELKQLVDEVVVVESPPSFFSVGQWYVEFGAVTDEEVRELLSRQAPRAAPPPATQ
jgi:putative phosphoribosyl transferase